LKHDERATGFLRCELDVDLARSRFAKVKMSSLNITTAAIFVELRLSLQSSGREEHGIERELKAIE